MVVLDDGGNWRGGGTAWKLAEDGHQVTIVTPDPLVGKELQRTAADFPLRARLAQLGVRMITESAVSNWGGEGASVVSLLTGEKEKVPAETLVLATTNIAEDALWRELTCIGIPAINIGDSVAPRLAPYAIYEGRKVALSL